MSKVVTLGKVVPDKALEGLNRLTGLVFESWPESLAGTPAKHPQRAAAQPADEPDQVARRTGSH